MVEAECIQVIQVLYIEITMVEAEYVTCNNNSFDIFKVEVESII